MSSQDDDPIVAYLIDHLFLPPRISEDWLNTACAVDKDSVNRVNQAELGLLSFVRETVHEFRKSEVLSAPTEVEGLKRAEKMLRVMQGLQASLSSSPQLESLLMQELTRMQEGGKYMFQVLLKWPCLLLGITEPRAMLVLINADNM